MRRLFTAASIDSREVEILVDRLEEEGLLAIAEVLVVRLVLGRDELVLPDEVLVRADFGVVVLDAVGLGVPVDIGRVRNVLELVLVVGVAGDDRDGALGADHVLHEERDLAHHRAPAGLVPADRAVIEGDVEVAVVRLGRIGPERGADAVHANRLGAGELAHHVDVVDAAIDDRDQRVDQVLVPHPGRAVALLVEVEAHHQRLAERLAELDELHPRGVDAKDVAEHELAVVLPRRRRRPLRRPRWWWRSAFP